MLAKVRADLIHQGVGVPVGKVFYFDSKPLGFRWTSEDNFQVLYQGLWEKAESIDWDFLEKL